MTYACPCCDALATQPLLRTPPMPVSSCTLRWAGPESLDFPKRSLDLWHCSTCAFVWNQTFDDAAVAYGSDYESTQIHSGVFGRYLQQVAQSWLQLREKPPRTILEVGCGQGEFLDLLEKHSDATLLGYDPAFRGDGPQASNILAQSLPETPSGAFDLVVNRMTLEHIARPYEFLSNVARWVAPDGTLITQVPNAERTIENGLVCDLFYEHVNYFTAASLVAVLRRAGFEHNRCEISYAQQHLTVFSTRAPTERAGAANLAPVRANALPASMDRFVAHWDRALDACADNDREVWLWGTGSRATTFVSLLSRPEILQGAIDINPRRTGSYVLGSSCRTYAPDALRGRSNLSVIIMNPIYEEEIKGVLDRLSLEAEIMLVEGV